MELVCFLAAKNSGTRCFLRLTDVLNALAQHHLVKDLASSHADKGVVHVRRMARSHLRLGIMAIESGRGNGPLSLLSSGSALSALAGVLHDGFRSGLLDGSIAVGRDSFRGGCGGETAGGGVDALESALRLACFEHCDEWRALWRSVAGEERRGANGQVAGLKVGGGRAGYLKDKRNAWW